MNVKAKVTIEAVKAFREATASINELQNSYYDVISYIQELMGDCEKHQISLDKRKGQIEQGKDKLVNQISVCENRISELEEEKTILENRLSDIEDEILSVPEYISVTDDSGNVDYKRNRHYDRLENEIDLLNNKINSVVSRIQELYDKKTKICNLLSDLQDIDKEVSLCLKELQYDKNQCIKIEQEIRDVFKAVSEKSNNTVDNLNKIEKLIERYLDLKIQIKNKNNGQISMVQATNTKNEVNVNLNVKIDNNSNNHIVNNVQNNIDLDKNKIISDNDYLYEVDNYGRPISASGKLKITPKKDRDEKEMRKARRVWGCEKLETDQRGHLIAHQFGGLDTILNLVPQDGHINNNEYSLLEDELANEVRRGKSVEVNVIPYYKNTSKRPEGICFYYKIDGESRIDIFPNYKEVI